ncbi:MAG: hypothetical protein LBU32_00615 [Clostridiales bacterium]|nr:hypothetical protein [Clostridiales bacterium]
MAITSISFFVFLAASLAVYFICPGRFQWVALLVASLIFSAFASGALILLIALMSFAAWGGALVADRLEGSRKSIASGAVVIFEAAILIALKENSFFVSNTMKVASLLSFSLNITMPDWAAPLGISYYTLMLIGYTLDVNWLVSKPEKNFLKFLLFSSYFPQMTSGPITRYREMENELFSKRNFCYEDFCHGLQRIVWGLFKKMAIADGLALYVSGVYGEWEAHETLLAAAAACYALQLYADFSGCMDIVIGASQLFGVKLPENFKTPFFAASISELWQRWHMTLGSWLKDYIMHPFLKSGFCTKLRDALKKRLGKKAAREAPTYLGLFLLWFSIGFWHGGSWKYICGSGLFFFAIVAGGRLLDPVFSRIKKILHINDKMLAWILFQRIRTFCLFAISISFGRAASLSDGFRFWKTAFLNLSRQTFYSEAISEFGLEDKRLLGILAGLLAILAVSAVQQKGSIRGMLDKKPLALRWAVFICLFFAVIIFGFYGIGYDKTSFIYGDF